MRFSNGSKRSDRYDRKGRRYNGLTRNMSPSLWISEAARWRILFRPQFLIANCAEIWARSGKNRPRLVRRAENNRAATSSRNGYNEKWDSNERRRENDRFTGRISKKTYLAEQSA